jgi:ABC-2 type transport system ATP-binding protein
LEYSIETYDITKKFALQKGFTEFIIHPFRKDEIAAVEKVNIKIRKGELFGILGPNGAGKTTLIKLLCTLILPTAGTAYVNGYDVAEDSGKVRNSIGFITTDERSFYWRLTGRQNLKFFASLHNYYSDNARKRVDELLNVVGLKNRADDKFLSYSAGMKQRMAISRGLLKDAPILILDEATSNMDTENEQAIRKGIASLMEGRTTLVIAHRLSTIATADHVVVLDHGRVVEVGTHADLVTNEGTYARIIRVQHDVIA